MKEVVIIFIVWIFIGKVYKGVFNNINLLILVGFVFSEVVKWVKIDFVEVDDVIMGCVLI